MKTTVRTYYQASVDTPVTIPDGKEIQNVYSKYGRVTIELDDGTEINIEESHLPGEGDDFKRPDSIKLILEEDNNKIIYEC